METVDLARLELLAEIDTLVERLSGWADAAPPWQPGETCRALVRRLVQRAATLRVRLDAPLVVAILGGTGTGKSALVNAIAGAELTRTGRQRPTTTRPTLLCHSGLTPEMLGIEPAEVDVVSRDLPALAHLVLVDCPDPDTNEVHEGTPAEGNLARLRRILPLCDVLLVVTTQQKYRSARVGDELAAAAPGAKLVFVQTHADVDADIRDDWRQVLEKGHPSHDPADDKGAPSRHYSPGHIFFVDSPSALAQAVGGSPRSGEFAALMDLLTREFAGAAAARIRRANFLDLAAETLGRCRTRLDAALPAVASVQSTIDEQRQKLSAELARQIKAELLASRRPWESRLLGQVTSRWGLSPFSLVLRTYQGLGGLLAGALLYRARTPAQLALWGAVQGARTWQSHRREKQARDGAGRSAASGWDPALLRASAMILEGYAVEAGLPRAAAAAPTVVAEADRAGLDFAAALARDLDGLVAQQAARHSGWFIRFVYELSLLGMLGMLLFRLGKNFFYDSWFAPVVQPVWGVESYLTAAFWLVLWCFVLLWSFTRRLRSGLRRSIDQLADRWTGAAAAGGIFLQLESHCRAAQQFRAQLETLAGDVDRLRQGMIDRPG